MDEERIAQLRALVEPILTERHAELVELTCRQQGGEAHVRLLVDRVGGVTIQHCARVNRLISQALEGAGFFEERYTLEVSSPGLDRPLVTTRDFERAIGEDLRVVVVKAEDRREDALEGMLLAVSPDAIVLKTISGNLTLPLSQIREAKKAMRW